MFFNRNYLIDAIHNAKKNNNKEIYKYLISIWYKLIEQEDINGTILNGFYCYEKIPDNVVSFYINTIK